MFSYCYRLATFWYPIKNPGGLAATRAIDGKWLPDADLSGRDACATVGAYVAHTGERCPPCTATDFLPSGLYRRPRHCTGSYLAARGLGLRLTADREFHPALKVCDCIQLHLVYARWGIASRGSGVRQGLFKVRKMLCTSHPTTPCHSERSEESRMLTLV